MSFGFGFGFPRAGGASFSPAVLFSAGEVGAWYDPSDSTTLFTTSAGTTPCAAPGSGAQVFVGRMLDKSQGLALGPELVTNGDFSQGTTGWTVSGSWPVTFSVVNARAVLTYSSSSVGRVVSPITCVIGKTYSVTGIGRIVAGTTANLLVALNSAGGGDVVQQSFTATTDTQLSFTFTATQTTHYIVLRIGAVNVQAEFDNVSVREIAGNHANAINDTTARPELSARVNLLTYSEQFDNAAWTVNGVLAFGSGSVANATTAPDGLNTADLIVENSAAATVHWIQSSSTANASGVYTISVFAKQKERSWIYVGQTAGTVTPGNSSAVWFDLANGIVGTQSSGYTGTIQSVGGGWYRCTATATFTVTSGSITPLVGISTGDNTRNYTGDGVSGVYVWGAQLVATNAFPANTYQRIADQYTYDVLGFPRYLVFNGSASAMSTPLNVNLTGTNKVTVFGGLRKLDSVGLKLFAELSITAGSVGSFGLQANTSATPAYKFESNGTGSIAAATSPATYSAPISSVLTGIGDIAAPVVTLRVNGAQVATDATSQGTGNYGTYPLYVGARAGTGAFFNGYLYSLIVRGAATSAGQITSTEQWVASKTGITI